MFDDIIVLFDVIIGLFLRFLGQYSIKKVQQYLCFIKLITDVNSCSQSKQCMFPQPKVNTHGYITC